MNHSRIRQALAALVVLCILVVGGLASAGSVTHESHHAHHQKATHSTALCAWMCAAGTALDSDVPLIQIETDPLEFTSILQSGDPATGFCRTFSSRAPPSFSL
jgi:hypothetical protein